ncbi:MAG: hypothetical protein XD63_1327 [Thermoanaerobacterales bacterium 50_218]|nr:MAG: hypothetical protein XD63_1327 [Thermoanaerobacterales bacterium 50_218]
MLIIGEIINSSVKTVAPAIKERNTSYIIRLTLALD